jgi:hypothetical protein
MRKNHETTTLLVAMAAIAATLLAAGTVAALGSNHFAFAHQDYKKREYKQGSDGSQYLKCIVVGNDGFKRSDGDKQRADLVATPKPTVTPGLGLGDNNGGGISDDSCNNFDGSSSTVHDGGMTPR